MAFRRGALELVAEPHRQLTPICQAGERVRMRLAPQPRDVADDLGEWPGEAVCEHRGQGERDRCREEDEAAVALRERVDGGHGLDRDERRARSLQRRGLSGERGVHRGWTRPPRIVHRGALRAAGDDASVAHEQQPRVPRQRRRLAQHREDVVAERQRDCDVREHAETVGDLGGRRDPRRRGELPDRAPPEVDAGVPRLRDPPQLGLVAGDHRALERERRRELRRLDAQVRAQRFERRGAHPRAAGEGGRVLLPAAAAGVAVERDRDGDDERGREQEDEHRVAGNGCCG